MYSHLIIFGDSPQFCDMHFFTWKKARRVFSHLILMCSLKFSFLSRVRPRYLTVELSCRVVLPIFGATHPFVFLLRVNRTISVLSGCIVRPFAMHHSDAILSPSCVFLQICVRSLPVIRIVPSSEYACVYMFILFSLFSSSSTTRHHKMGESTPPCGHPFVAATVIVVVPDDVMTMRFFRRLSIHLVTSFGVFRVSRAVTIVCVGALSNAPDISKKVPNAYWLLCIAVSIFVTALCSAVSVDFPI